MKRFSFALVTEKLRLIGSRFPLTLICITGVATLFFIFNNFPKVDIPQRLWYLFVVGIPISMTVALWIEDRAGRLPDFLLTLFATALWGAYCHYLVPDEPAFASRLQIIAIGLVFTVSFFFIAFLKRGKDAACWNFLKEVLWQMILSVIFAGILFAGICIAFFSLENLFGLTVHNVAFLNLYTACFVLFAPLYTLAHIPDRKERQSDETVFHKPLKMVSLYILPLLLGLYALILYAYLVQILIRGELPNGWLSTLVSIFVSLGLFIILLAWPLRKTDEGRLVGFLSRYFVLFALPLLILMSVGIYRRITDYGFTILRVYLLLLNLWFYGITLYLFITKGRRFKWILISPTLILLLASVGPWSVSESIRRMMTEELEQTLIAQDLLDNGKITGMESADATVKESIAIKLNYLEDTYGWASIRAFFPDSMGQQALSQMLKDMEYTSLSAAEYPEYRRVNYYSHRDRIRMPLSYPSFLFVDYDREQHAYADDDKEWDYDLLHNSELTTVIADGSRIVIPLKTKVTEWLAREKNAGGGEPEEGDSFTLQGEKYVFYLREIKGLYYPATDSLQIARIQGFLFY
jgi:hypothetical protein